MKLIPYIQEEIEPNVFINKSDYSKLSEEDKKIIENNFGTLSTDQGIMFFETKEEYEQYSIKYLPDPNIKIEEPVILSKDDQIKLRALLAAQEASQINTK